MIEDRRPNPEQINFLHTDLLDQLNLKHPLLRLAENIPWDYFVTYLRRCIPIKGGPPNPFGDGGVIDSKASGRPQ